MSVRYVVRCQACGAVEHVSGQRGEVTHVTVAHEDDCPFFHAVEEGQAAAMRWVEAHGYPISYRPEAEN